MTTQVKNVDPRVKRTRQLLQKAFLALMHEKNFRSISIQDIAERATVNRATFYAHFEDKYALLDSCIRDGFEEMLAARLSPETMLSRESLRTLILTTFDYVGQIHHSECTPAQKQFDPLFEEAVQQELYSVLLNWLRRTPATGIQRQAPFEATAMVLSWAIFGSAVRWSQGARTVTAEKMADQVLAVITSGLTIQA